MAVPRDSPHFLWAQWTVFLIRNQHPTGYYIKLLHQKFIIVSFNSMIFLAQQLFSYSNSLFYDETRDFEGLGMAFQ